MVRRFASLVCDGSYTKLMASLAKADVLILDDLGLGTLQEAQHHDLLKVLEDRCGDHSTIVTSQSLRSVLPTGNGVRDARFVCPRWPKCARDRPVWLDALNLGMIVRNTDGFKQAED